MKKKKILFVDDSQSIRQNFKEWMSFVEKTDYELTTATNGIEAIKALKESRPDVLVTDLQMPELDGFGLLLWVAQNRKSLPVMIMTGFGTPEVEDQVKRLGGMKMLKKPVSFEVVLSSVDELLEGGAEEGSLSGISIGNFLQLVNMEQKTCRIEVCQGETESGYFDFVKGELMDARFGTRSGEAAALALLAVDKPKINMKKLAVGTVSQQIARPLMAILLDGAKDKDEADSESGGDNGPEDNEGALPGAEEDAAVLSEEAMDELGEADFFEIDDEVAEKRIGKVQTLMHLFSTVEGFRAAIAYSNKGNILAEHAIEEIDMKALATIALAMEAVNTQLEKNETVGPISLRYISGRNAQLIIKHLHEAVVDTRTEKEWFAGLVVVLGVEKGLLEKNYLHSIISEILLALN